MKTKLKKLLSFVMVLALMVGFVPGMGLTALAGDETPAYAGLKNTINVVNFDGKEWYLIDYDESTVTLLSKECVGASEFNPQAPNTNTYNGSIVEGFVNSWYAGNISPDAKAAVDGNGMFLLTKDQAINLSTDVLKCSKASGAYSNDWWLCTPGSTDSSAERVNGNTGVVNTLSGNVWINYGVRPALKLDLSSVIFSSEQNTFSKKVNVSGVSLNKEEVTLKIDGTETLTATVSPEDASDKSVTWSSSDTSVATVADGVVTAVAAGTATITATATNGTDDTGDDQTATCAVTVTEPAAGTKSLKDLAALWLFNTNDKIEYRFNESYSGRLNQITKIEALVEVESMSWGQVVYNKNANNNEGHYASFDTLGVKKYTAGEGTVQDADFAGVQLQGEGKLLAYTITFSEGNPLTVTGGDWKYPEFTFPTGLTATVGQTLADVTLPSADNGTWTWADSTTSVGEAGVNTFYATFTPDTTVLHTITDIPVSVTVEAAPAASVTSGDTTNSYTTFADAVTAWTDGSTLTLLSNVETADTISMSSGTKTINLNGHSITKTGNEGSVFQVTGGSLTVNGAGGTITGGKGMRDGYRRGGGFYISNGEAIVRDVIIAGNDAGYGGGMYINGGTFTMENGTITQNTITSDDNSDWFAGAAAFVEDGTFIMNGGRIYDNRINNNKGEVCGVNVQGVDGQPGVKSPTFIVSGDAEISGDSGAVRLLFCGAVLKVSGTPKICGANNYVYIVQNDKKIVVDGELSEGANIAVKMDTPGVFTTTSSENTQYNDASKFKSDNGAYVVVKNDSGQLELAVPPAASVTSGGQTAEYTTFADALTAWADGSTLTLLDDVTTATTISVTGTQTLDLNGHGIRMTGSGSVINVGGASLTLNDSAPNALHKYTIQNPKSNGAGLAVVDDANGTQTFTGGYITGGNTVDRGGGVVVNGGSLTMNGGTVIGNNAESHGGGVAINANGGAVKIKGGALIGNVARYGGGISAIGGGAITISGGEIKYNHTTRNGGGVHTDENSTLTITGGVIIYNYTDGDGGRHGGGMVVGNKTGLNLSGNPTIEGNQTSGAAENIYLCDSNKINITGFLSNNTPIGVTMQTPGVFTSTASDKVSFNDPTKFVSDNGSYTVIRNSDGQLALADKPVAKVGEEEYTDFATALTAWADGSTLTLLDDVTTATTISVTATKTLDLNGHGIRMTGSGSVISVGSGANLTLNDSDPNGAHNTQTFTGGYITGGNTADKGGGVLINGGSLTMNGGTVIGNKADKEGGGVLINGGSLTMNGGTIKDNNAYDGGGVYVVSGATLHMTGGAIEGNRATHNGAGVAVEDGATFQMSGGAIRYNACNRDTGGVLLRGDSADFTMSGGSIQYNTGSAIGGIGSWHAQPKFSGAPVVKDNVKGGTVRNTGTGYILEGGTPCNVYNIGSVTVIVGALQDGAEIGMTIPDVDVGVFTGSANTAFNDPSKFVSDNASYAVGKNADGQLLLGTPVTVTFNTDGGGAVASQTVASGSLVTEPTAPSKTGYTFGGWYTDSGLTTVFDFNTAITADTTLYAKWILKRYTVTFDANGGSAVASQTVDNGSTATKPANPTRSGYTFGGWYADSGLTSAFDFNTAVTADTTLYAKWTLNQYTVTFDANGGTGTMDEQSADYQVATALAENAFSRADYTFAGWNTEADGTGTPYADGASITLTGDLTLYAQWTAKPLYGISGTVTQSGAKVAGATVRLVQGDKNIAVTTTDSDGAFSFSAPDGTYNIVAEKDGKTKTELVTLSGTQTVEIDMPAANVNSKLTVTGSTDVMVGGLDAEAEAIKADNAGAATVTVTMSVESKETNSAANAEDIQTLAENQELKFIEIKVEKTVDGETTAMTETTSVLEITVPYTFKKSMYDVKVYRYHGASAAALTEANTKADGTYWLDKDNSLIHIYAKQFSTYAIGYTQCYNINGSLKYGTYTGEVTMSLLDDKRVLVQYITVSISDGLGKYKFTHIPKGRYYLSTKWFEADKEIVLEKELIVQ